MRLTMRMTRTTWVTTGVVAVSIGLALALRGSAAPPESNEPARVRARVRVMEVRRWRLDGAVRAGGFLRARSDITVSAERAGRVLALPVMEGATVAAGRAVAHLDDTSATANLARARTAAREAGLQPDLSASELAGARANLRLAEHEFRLHHPVSPIVGTVEVHHVDEGEYVRAGAPLVDVVDASVLILDLDVDAEAVGGLRIGAQAALRVGALGQAGRRTGTIRRLASRADPVTRRFRVEIAVDGSDRVLKPGMHALARITLPGGDLGVFLPKSAARRAGGGTELGIFVLDEGVVRWKTVRVEEVYQRPDLWRLLEPALANGTAVVVSGFSGLRDGMAVAVAR